MYLTFCIAGDVLPPSSVRPSGKGEVLLKIVQIPGATEGFGGG